MVIPTRLTVSALEGLPEGDDKRYELIQGEIHGTTQPTLGHQLVSDTVVTILRAWNRQFGQGGLAVSAPGIILAEDEAFAPDVVWYSRAAREIFADLPPETAESQDA